MNFTTDSSNDLHSFGVHTEERHLSIKSAESNKIKPVELMDEGKGLKYK